jgi:hypothetical protein
LLFLLNRGHHGKVKPCEKAGWAVVAGESENHPAEKNPLPAESGLCQFGFSSATWRSAFAKSFSGPMALRPRIATGLPLSEKLCCLIRPSDTCFQEGLSMKKHEPECPVFKAEKDL